MEYLLAGSQFAVDVVRPSKRPGEVPSVGRSGLMDGATPSPVSGPTRADFDRLARGELPALILAGRYRLERRIGRGGMGSVYFGRHLALGRPVAVKVLDAEDQEWSWAVARFMREARLAAKVRHRNIVDIHDFGSTPDGVVYIVMEALLGRDLRAIVAKNRLTWASAHYLMQQICAAVDAIHMAGVVHRDLKASNCFYVEQNRQVKLLDFGIATDFGVGIPLGPEHGLVPSTPAKSQGGCKSPDRSIVGTPEYMAPEQIRGAATDRRSDVYAGGILLFELLTGQTPFAGQTVDQVFDLHLEAPPPSLACVVPNIDVPEGLDAIVARALAKDPRRRFQTMREFGAALDHVGDSSRLRRLFGRRSRASGSTRFEARQRDASSQDPHASRTPLAIELP